MNLYLVSQDQNNEYDSYDSFVCAAENETEARWTNPRPTCSPADRIMKNTSEDESEAPWSSTWTHPKNVSVKLIGTAEYGTLPGVICVSLNAR